MDSTLEQRIAVQLRWRDMDMLGHLNQSVYHELLEEGRAALIWDLLQRVGSDPAHGSYVLAHVDLDYRTEVRKDHGQVDVVIRVGSVGRSSFRLLHEIRLPDGTVAASGETVMVAWDPRTRAKRELTPGELEALSVPSAAA
ncbi:MAG TPA: thioesterase family protein [Solirubrobacteraceae bacterium]